MASSSSSHYIASTGKDMADFKRILDSAHRQSEHLAISKDLAGFLRFARMIFDNCKKNPEVLLQNRASSIGEECKICCQKAAQTCADHGDVFVCSWMHSTTIDRKALHEQLEAKINGSGQVSDSELTDMFRFFGRQKVKGSWL